MADLALAPPNPVPRVSSPPRSGADARLRGLLATHHGFVWRQLRRLGLSADVAEDAAQQVFLIASRRLADIAPESEKSFLFGTARRVASELRRSTAARRETPGENLPDSRDPAPLADEQIDRGRARALLDTVLDSMDEDLRVVFILFELEEMKIVDIGDLLGLPVGTVGSRLRRARDDFQDTARRLKARGELSGARR